MFYFLGASKTLRNLLSNKFNLIWKSIIIHKHLFQDSTYTSIFVEKKIFVIKTLKI